MVDNLPMFTENLDDQPTSRRAIIFVGVAVLLVAVMIAALWTWTNLQGSVEEFHDDCTRLGGETHDLGEETICLLDERVVGRM